MPVIIETERLILRKIKLFDAPAMFEMDSNPNVLKYLGIDKIKSVEVSKQHILNIQYQYEKCGVGRLAVVLKSTNEFIGWSGLKHITEMVNNHQNIFDLGYLECKNVLQSSEGTEFLNIHQNTIKPKSSTF